MLDPIVEPIAFAEDQARRIVVTVHQIVCDRAGTLLVDQHVQHVYSLRDGFVCRMQIASAPPARFFNSTRTRPFKKSSAYVNKIMTTPVTVRSGRVTTEGDDLYYEVRGHGQPLLMIPGGGGDGGSYSAVADILSDEFTVTTFDRRGHARSTMNDPQNFEVTQQSRDAVAVLRAAGETSAFVFGNSSGAVIALDMAKTQPMFPKQQ